MSTASRIPFTAKNASARKANSSGATGHLIGISVMCTTSRPPVQVASLSRKAIAPSSVGREQRTDLPLPDEQREGDPNEQPYPETGQPDRAPAAATLPRVTRPATLSTDFKSVPTMARSVPRRRDPRDSRQRVALCVVVLEARRFGLLKSEAGARDCLLGAHAHTLPIRSAASSEAFPRTIRPTLTHRCSALRCAQRGAPRRCSSGMCLVSPEPRGVGCA